MEDQFIIRVPECIRDRVVCDVKENRVHKLAIKMISSKEGMLTYENKTYPGYITDMPCIVETHKTLDNRQFIKVADVSKVFVFAEDQSTLGSKVEQAKMSGITPPMAYVRNRRFRKRLTKAPIVEEIEKAVADMLQRDREALRVDVQVINKGENETEEDVSSLAAEIELNMLENEQRVETEPVHAQEGLHEKEEELKNVLIKIQEKKTEMESIANPILRKRFQDSIVQLEQDKEKIERDIQRITKEDV